MYADIFKECTGINIEEREEHPPWICGVCEEKLLEFYLFKNQCLKSDEVITNFLNTRTQMDIEMDIYPDFNEIFERSVIEPGEEIPNCTDSDTDSDSDSIIDIENNGLLQEENKPIICKLCKEILPTTLKEYNRHIGTHDPTNPTPFECKTCNAKFVNSNSLKIHRKSHKKEKDRFKSVYCSTWFKKSSSLFRHDNIYHTGERIFNCDISNESFLTFNRLNKHIEKWHSTSSDTTPIVCRKPPFSNDPKPIKRCPNTVTHDCILCNRKFPTRSNLQLHNKSFHSAPVAPPLTEETMPFDDNPIEAYQCEFCGKCFTDLNSFDVHKMFHPEYLEEGETLSKNAVTGNFSCSKCDLKIYQLALYEAHMDKFHRNDYSCDVCKKFFIHREQLPQHRRTHFKQNNHVCIQCDKRFIGSSLLRKHIRKFHPGNIPVKPAVVKGKCLRRKTYVKIFSIK